MKPGTIIAVAGLLLTLQTATLAYAVRVESRLTRLETIIDLQRPARAPALQERAS